ncbi:MAG: hypothetical protein E7623_03810 [Ruminococcaceae bacterium]|nr:hypothetical protein [Oscillospiraceae bacterium]
MTDKLLNIIREKYILNELDPGEFSHLKANGMKFTVKAYNAVGLGHVSVMKAKGFFELMKMDTLMVVPEETDLPLYSYDRILAMGNDTLIVELYNTFSSPSDMSSLDLVKEKYSHLPERDPGVHWYDGIKFPQSISKKGKKSISTELDSMTAEHFSAYLKVSCEKASDIEKKRELSSQYVNGLLERGGPSTDVFKKALGHEATEKLFKKVLFGIE